MYMASNPDGSNLYTNLGVRKFYVGLKEHIK